MTLSDVQISQQGAVVVAVLSGEVDLSNTRAIEEAVVAATPNHASGVVLDVSPLDYLDSAGIQLIYQLREKLQVRGQQLGLVVPQDSAASDALRLAGVLEHLETSVSAAEAIAGWAEESQAGTESGMPGEKIG